MTTIGMAMAYEKIGSQSRALRLVERAMRLIDEKKADWRPAAVDRSL
jgi:hypothetical protein